MKRKRRPKQFDPSADSRHRSAMSAAKTFSFMAIAITLAGCATTARLDYPGTRQSDQTDDYHGVKVADPYRWLEDDNSAETKAWVEAQNKVTFAYLEQIPQRAAIKSRLTELSNYERYGIPFKQGERYFIAKNDGLQNQSVLYTMASLDAEPKLLLDPNQLSADGTVALSGYDISDDGNLMAYGVPIPSLSAP
jgi:prolyl oligopeptidase